MIAPQDSVKIDYKENRASGEVSFDIADLIHSADLLRKLLIKETALFRDMEIKEANKLFKEKTDLIDMLETQKGIIASNPDIVELLTKEEITALKKTDKELDKVMKENFHEILKAKEINQRVVEAVSRALSKHERRASWYDKNGVSDDSIAGHGEGLMVRAGGDTPAITLNEMI